MLAAQLDDPLAVLKAVSKAAKMVAEWADSLVASMAVWMAAGWVDKSAALMDSTSVELMVEK